MPAYAISEVTILDEKGASRYRALADQSIARYGGRYLVRAGAVAALEGTWPSDRALIVVEFPSMERAREWMPRPSMPRLWPYDERPSIAACSSLKARVQRRDECGLLGSSTRPLVEGLASYLVDTALDAALGGPAALVPPWPRRDA